MNTSGGSARVEYSTSIQSRFENISALTPIHSAIVIGADVYIDDSVIPENDGKPRAIIALRDEE